MPVASLIFGITLVSSFIAFSNPHIFNSWKLNPHNFVHYRKYYTVITSGLIHGDYMHLIFNMLTFYYFAFACEAEMGSLAFAALYIVSLVTSDISTIIKYRNTPSYSSLGASGAISAIIFAMIIFRPDMQMGLIFLPIMVPGPVFGLIYILFSMYAGRRGQGNINHFAHLWGAATGVLFTILFFPERFLVFLGSIGGMLHL